MIVPFLSPHRRAERLIDERVDAARGDRSTLTPSDARWLESHLAGCASCQRREAERSALGALLEAMPAVGAPEGFVERVRLRAAREAAETSEAPRARYFDGRLTAWLAAGGAAVALALGVAGATLLPGAPRTGEVAVGGAARLAHRPPHFVVRAPATGAARFRAVATKVVEAHDGEVSGALGRLEASIPRAALVDLMAELERRGGIEVELAAELDDATEQVYLRFLLD